MCVEDSERLRGFARIHYRETGFGFCNYAVYTCCRPALALIRGVQQPRSMALSLVQFSSRNWQQIRMFVSH